MCSKCRKTHRATGNAGHLRCVLSCSCRAEARERKKHIWSQPHVLHSACCFRFSAGALLHASFTCRILENLTCTFSFLPTPLLLCSKTGAIPPTSPYSMIPSSLSIIQRSPFRPSSPRVLQKKASAAAEACSRRRARFQGDRINWMACAIVGAIFYFFQQQT